MGNDLTTKHNTTFDKILSSYLDTSGTVRLTPKQKEVKKRWEAAYSMLCNWETQEDTVDLLRSQFVRDNGETLSRAQAYRDIRNAINLFGDITKTTKDGVRNIINQMTYKAISLAIEKSDVDNLTRLLSVLVKNNGTDKDDPDLPDFKDIQPPIQLIQINNTFIEKYKNILPPEIIKKAKTIKIEAE